MLYGKLREACLKNSQIHRRPTLPERLTQVGTVICICKFSIFSLPSDIIRWEEAVYLVNNILVRREESVPWNSLHGSGKYLYTTWSSISSHTHQIWQKVSKLCFCYFEKKLGQFLTYKHYMHRRVTLRSLCMHMTYALDPKFALSEISLHTLWPALETKSLNHNRNVTQNHFM